MIDNSKAHFLEVTELSGEEISREQLERLCHRYYWAAEFCSGRDVLEVACGSGPGLNYLAGIARTLKAGDYSPEVLQRAQAHVAPSVELKSFDAQDMPYPDSSFDVVLMFEALYYVPSFQRFFSECRRVLRPGGKLLITTANKDLYDFNPSPYSHVYLGVTELARELGATGFTTSLYGYLPIEKTSWRQRILRPIKKAAVSFGLMPKTMAGKRLLKRLVFGAPVLMPESITPGMIEYKAPDAISAEHPDRTHKVIYCAAGLP